MKINTIFITAVFVSSISMYAGKEIFKFTPLAYGTIKEALEDNNIRILDDNDRESWLVLAQKYRENGTVTWQKERKHNLWINPNFLNNEDYSSIKDEELAENIKKRCKESLDEKYSFFLYRKVTKWCDLVLTDEEKLVLKFQIKDKNICKFKIFRSPEDVYGLFVWEVLEDYSFSRKDLISLNSALQDGISYRQSNNSPESVSKWGYEILEECKKSEVVKITQDNLIIGDKNQGKNWRLKSKVLKTKN